MEQVERIQSENLSDDGSAVLDLGTALLILAIER